MHSQINIVDKINESLEKKIEEGHVAYETVHGIDVNYKSFAITITDEHDDICGILNAYTVYSEIYVDDIWVEEHARGKGYGRQLLQALENHFAGKGIGKQVATTLFDKFPGIWEIQQMPCNLPAIKFWRKIINDFTNNQFTEIKKIIYKPDPHESNVMRFQVNR